MRLFSEKDGPLYQAKKLSSINFADNSDIIDTIKKALPGAINQVKKISKNFKGVNITDSANNIWNYLKDNIRYLKDDDNYQVIKYPSALLNDKTGDCKSLALFSASILSNLKIPYVIRYVNQTGGTIPRHVYIVAFDENNEEVIIDAVWNYFNDEPPQIKYKKDYNYNTKSVGSIAYKNYTIGDFIEEKLENIYGGVGEISLGAGITACALAASLDSGVAAAIAASGGSAAAFWVSPPGLVLAAKIAIENGVCIEYANQLANLIPGFGATPVSNKPDELVVNSSPNSVNLYRLVFTGFRPQNINTNYLSNAWVLDHVKPDTKQDLKDAGVEDKYLDWDFHQYIVRDLYDTVGKGIYWQAFLQDLKKRYGNNDTITKSGSQYNWEVAAFKDYVDNYTISGNSTPETRDNFLYSFGIITPSKQLLLDKAAANNINNKAVNSPGAKAAPNYLVYGGIAASFLVLLLIIK